MIFDAQKRAAEEAAGKVKQQAATVVSTKPAAKKLTLREIMRLAQQESSALLDHNIKWIGIVEVCRVFFASHQHYLRTAFIALMNVTIRCSLLL